MDNMSEMHASEVALKNRRFFIIILIKTIFPKTIDFRIHYLEQQVFILKIKCQF